MKKILTCFILFFYGATFAQRTYTNKAFGISITIPKVWYKTHFNENDSLSDKEKLDLIGKWGYNIAEFGKMTSLSKHAVNSKISIEVMLNKQAGDFEEFKDVVEWSIENNIKPRFKEFSIKQALTEVNISGTKSLYVMYQYDYEMEAGWIAKVKNRMYIIPFGKYFFRVMCVDAQDEKYDSSKDFEEMIGSIKIVP